MLNETYAFCKGLKNCGGQGHPLSWKLFLENIESKVGGLDILIRPIREIYRIE